MADSTPSSSKAPWHLWVVGAVSLLWNAMGALDFTLTQTHNEAWLKALTPEQLAYFAATPTWVVLAWAVGTWGSLLGSALLLLRRRIASGFFTASLLGAILTDVYMYFISDALKIMKGGAGMISFSVIIAVIVLLLRVYAKKMAGRGVLR